MTATRRTVLAALPLATWPDFSAPLAASARNPDADLIALCEEHRRQWAIADDWDISQDESDAATEETTRLNKALSVIPARTLAGVQAKARVLAFESGHKLPIGGPPVDLSHVQHDEDRVLLSLLADLTGTHEAVA